MRIKYSLDVPFFRPLNLHSSIPVVNRDVETRHRIRLDFHPDTLVNQCVASALGVDSELDYYGESRPAGQTCRDFLDLQLLPTNCLLICIGEVLSERTGTRIIASGLQALLRNRCLQAADDLGPFVGAINRALCDIAPDDCYATLFCASLDPIRRQLQYVSAGHEPALLFDQSSRRLRRLESTGTVLGLTTRAIYRQHAPAIEAGDLLVAYTDGITDAAARNGRALREDGVAGIVRTNSGAGSAEMCRYILEAAERFRAGLPAMDDETVVVARVRNARSAQPFRSQAEELAMAAA